MADVLSFLVPVAIAAAFLVAIVLVNLLTPKSRGEAMPVDVLGLRPEEGRYRGRPVRFEKNGSVCTIQGGPQFLSLETRGVATLEEGITIADPEFNRMFLAQGPRTELLALFDQGLRARLVRTFRNCRVLISSGITRIESTAETAVLTNVVRDAAILLDDLEAAAARDLPSRLGDRAIHEPLPGIRIAAFLELRDRFPDSSEMKDALRAALDDPDPDMRRLAGAQGGGLTLAVTDSEGALSPATAEAGALSIPPPKRR